MALEEAIARFNYQYVHSSCKTHICDNDCDKCIEARHELIEAAEKQIPKKPEGRSVRYGIDEEYSVEYSCSKCGRYVGDEYYKKTTVAIADRL